MRVFLGTVCGGKDCRVESSIPDNLDMTEIVYHNKDSLSSAYNNFIHHAKKIDADWLVLCHNDITIETVDLKKRLENTEFDVVGVAGATKIKLEEPALWHLMSHIDNVNHHAGAVAHVFGDSIAMTSFGPYPKRCLVLDGVFLAISKKVYSKLLFDEGNPAKFHFYDLDYTLSAHKEGFKVGVDNILITHESHGLSSFTDEWRQGQKWFLNKHTV